MDRKNAWPTPTPEHEPAFTKDTQFNCGGRGA
jgi:hypothetical protein